MVFATPEKTDTNEVRFAELCSRVSGTQPFDHLEKRTALRQSAEDRVKIRGGILRYGCDGKQKDDPAREQKHVGELDTEKLL